MFRAYYEEIEEAVRVRIVSEQGGEALKPCGRLTMGKADFEAFRASFKADFLPEDFRHKKRVLPAPGLIAAFMTYAKGYEGDACLIWPFAGAGGKYPNITVKGRPKNVCRLLCEKTYGPAPEPHMQAAHSCGKGKQGCVAKSHLRWATPKENSADKEIHGTVPRGEFHKNSKLTEESVRYIRENYPRVSQRLLAKQLGVAQNAVKQVLRRQTWKHVN